MAKENFTPLWKDFIFPALGLAANIAIIAVKGFPPILWVIATLAAYVAGSWWVHYDWKEQGEESLLPAVACTIVPVVLVIAGLATA